MGTTTDLSVRAIGRYQILDLVGAGSMGNVYRALDPLLHRIVALKTVRQDSWVDGASTTPFKVRFYREGQILGSLSHPNIVSLYDMGECESSPYMVMEYANPQSLATLLSSRRAVGLDSALTLLQPLADAIDYAHRMGVVHLDLKPSNILVDDGWECPKISDFGVAKILGNGLDSSLGLFGTPGYMSPEQVRSEALSHQSDLFSFAVVAFEMLSGERPFPGASVEAVLYRVAHGEPVLPSALAAMGYSEADWTWLFSKALAKEPRERFSAAAELVDELGSLHPSGSAIWGRSHGAGALDSPSIHALPTIALPGRSRPRGLGRRPALSVLSAAGASGLLFVSLGISTSPAGPRGALQRTATEASASSDRGSRARETTPLETAPLASGIGARALDERDAPSGIDDVPSDSNPKSSGPGSAPASTAVDLAPRRFAPVASRVPLSASVRLRNGVLVVENQDAFDWMDVELTLGRRGALELGKFRAGRLYSLPLSVPSPVSRTSAPADLAHEDVTIVCRTPMGRGWYSVRAVASH